MEIKNFKAVDHQTIKAKFNIYIEKWDLYLNKMILLYTANGKFVSAPSEKYEKDGETKYFPYYAFGKDSNKQFQAKVMELLKPYLAQLEVAQGEFSKESGEPQKEQFDELPF